MLISLPYDRSAAVAYARLWAYGRNNRYTDFEHMGGDCTNFVSQCIYAGTGVMNYTPTFGWYYVSQNDRAPAWTGVQFLYNFLVNNDGIGPYAKDTDKELLENGDVVFLCDESNALYHTLIVVATTPKLLIASHSYDAYSKPLSAYTPLPCTKYVHIEGFRVKNKNS